MKKLLIVIYTSLGIACISGCIPQEHEKISGFPEGFWQSNGYGLVIQVKDGIASAFDVTDRFCTRSKSEQTLAIAIESVVPDEQVNNVKVQLYKEQHRYYFTRIDTLPKACINSVKATPQSVFNEFVALMEKHYVFFELYGIDWQKRTTKARNKVSKSMTDTELFTLFTDMLAGIDDAHLSLSAEIEGKERVYDPDPGAGYAYAIAHAEEYGMTEAEAKQFLVSEIWRNQIATKALKGKGTMIAGNRIQYGMLDNGVGYLGVVTMGGFIDEENVSPEQEFTILQQSLDQALVYFKQHAMKSLILDVSFNHGGYDFVSLEIASRFTSKPIKSYSKFPADAARSYSSDITIIPSKNEKFTGPVFMFTSDMTVSAGEILVLAMRPMPNVSHIGETTRGALSSVLEKTLPNGWLLNISNEVYLDNKGELWESKGIPPDVSFPVFKSQDPINSFASAMKKAVILAQTNPKEAILAK